jgi:hypothetical protein
MLPYYGASLEAQAKDLPSLAPPGLCAILARVKYGQNTPASGAAFALIFRQFAAQRSRKPARGGFRS